jgi:ABC-type dipeptide/oligopeptide/nickel transport system permease component
VPIDTLDIPMTTGTVLVAAVFMVVMNFLVDSPTPSSTPGSA